MNILNKAINKYSHFNLISSVGINVWETTSREVALLFLDFFSSSSSICTHAAAAGV